jgi:AAA15 family ATPase/GTPase
MKLEKLVFRSIRNFSEVMEFHFNDTTKINTISGKNGSGKSTIFKSIVLCQKAFFLEQVFDNDDLRASLSIELAKFSPIEILLLNFFSQFLLMMIHLALK